MRRLMPIIILAIWIGLLFTFNLQADEKVFFYTTSSIIPEQQWTLYPLNFSPSRKIISLNGSYELLDFRSSKKIADVHIPAIYYQRVPFIFRRNFRVPAGDYSQYFLHFDQLNGLTQIIINNKEIYRGSRNFLPQSYPIPSSLLNPDDNWLEIKIIPWEGQSEQLPGWIPINLPRIHSGINGRVFLEALPSAFLSDFSFQWKWLNEELDLTGEINVYTSPKQSGNFRLQIQLWQNGVILKSREIPLPIDSSSNNQLIPIQLEAVGVIPWSSENPTKQILHMSLWRDQTMIDQTYRRLAIREVAVKDKKLFLNGSAIPIQGINYIYQDMQGTGITDPQLIANDLQNIKSKGFNVIRMGYYPQSRLVYHLADSLGLLCLQDLPYPLFMDKMLSDSLAEQLLTDYVRSFQEVAIQHPCIIGVGIGNLYHDPLLKRSFNYQQKIRELLSGKGQFLIYTSSFDWKSFPNEFADFYCLEVLERNDLPRVLRNLEQLTQQNYAVILSGLSKPISYPISLSPDSPDVNQITQLIRAIHQAPWKGQFLGLFLCNYSDYILETPSLTAGLVDRDHFTLNSSGLYTRDRLLKKEADILLKQKWALMDSDYYTEPKQEKTYIFIVVGLINLVFFLFLYRSFVDFRKNIFRVIRKPHGFFVELLERRMISFEQSFFLMVMISVNGAVMLGGICYYFRNNLLADYLLSLPLAFSGYKLSLARIIWEPLWLVIVLTIGIMITFILLTIPIHVLSLLRKTNIRIRQSLATSTWSAAPFIFLLPFGMFFYNLLLVMNSHWILFLILLYFHFWYYLRWLNGTRVMCVWSYPWVFLYSLLFILVVGGGLYIKMQQKIDVFMHLNFLLQWFTFHFN